jgi:hypothetical protein
MLDAFIIEEIRRRERLRQQQEERDRPFVELPLPDDEPMERQRPKRRTDREDDRPNRGVVVIDMAV